MKIGSDIGEVYQFYLALTSCFVAQQSKCDSGCSNNPKTICSGPEILGPAMVWTNSFEDLVRTRHCWRGLDFSNWVAGVDQQQDFIFGLSFPPFDNCS